MPFVQRVVEPKYLSRTSLLDADGKPLVVEDELDAVTNNTLSNALRQLASLVLVADDIFTELNGQLQKITDRSESLKAKIDVVEEKVVAFDPKKVAVPESDIATFALLKHHFQAKHDYHTELFSPTTRPNAVRQLYEAAAKTPVHLMRQMDRWRRDGHRTSRFFMCTPVLGAKRRRIRNKVDIDIETRMPALVEELRRWTSIEALGDVTVSADGPSRIFSSTAATDGDITDGTVVSDDEAIDHKLPSPEEQLQVVALKFPAEIVAVDVTGRSFDRMSVQRRSLLHGDAPNQAEDGSTLRRRTRSRKPRSRRRNTLAGTDQKEIRDALTAGEDQSSAAPTDEPESSSTPGAVARSKSSDLSRSLTKKESPESKKSHFNTLKQWGKSRLKMITNYAESKSSNESKMTDPEDVNIYETVTVRRKRSVEKERKSLHERKPSCSSSENTSINVPINTQLTAAMNIANVRLRESSAQRRLRRSGDNKDEPHSSSGNWSASSESGRASIGSEITNTTQPKSTTSVTTSNNSLNQHAPSSVNSRRRFNFNTSASGSVTSEGTLTPDIIHDLHEDGETSSVYSCDTEGYYTSFHMDSGLKTLKEEDSPVTPLHSTSAFSHSSSNNTVLSAENEYELFGKGSTSTTTSSAGTVCTTLRASHSNRSLIIGPAVPERKSSLSKLPNKDKSPESSLERDYSSDKTGTVKRSPASSKATVVAVVHKQTDGDVSPDSGHNTSSSPIESINSPNGVRSCSEFEFSESSDMEGADRIERIRVKTTINSSRIPSMCVITPTHSDDESVKSNNFDDNKINNNLNTLGSKNESKRKLDLPIPCENNNNLMDKVIANGSNKVQVINVNPQTGYATIENQGNEITKSSHRAPSPSGGTVTVKETVTSKSPQLQPIFKATLLPLNNMFGRLKLNFSNLRRDSKSPVKNAEEVDGLNLDAGEYVTISDVKNNNEKAPTNVYSNDVVNHNLKTVLSGKIRETEYISLNELPCNDPDGNLHSPSSTADSLERRRRQGARVTLDAEGKVVYSSDSLKRRKAAHSTFEPGPFVKPPSTPTHSPLPTHRTPKQIRPVSQEQKNQSLRVVMDVSRPLSPQLGKVVIKASPGLSSPTSEFIRMPPSTIVSPRPMSPKPSNARGAYVNVQEQPRDEGRALSPSNQQPAYNTYAMPAEKKRVYGYNNPLIDSNILAQEFERNCSMNRGGMMYSTLPSRKSQYKVALPERSVTPDITRGLDSNLYESNSMERKRPGQPYRYTSDKNYFNNQPLHQNLGIPVQIPQVNMYNLRTQVPNSSYHTYQPVAEQKTFSPLHTQKQFRDVSNDSFKVSPIDPRNLGGFQSSTPSKVPDLRAASNLENKLLSPKKSTMSNEELYAAIHKSKKKMNIQNEDIDRGSPVLSNSSLSPVSSESSLSTKVVKPESGYLGDKSKSRLSWSPNNGEYVDFNTNIDKIPPTNESRSRQSWACSDNKKDPQTSRLDFKKLLLMHGKPKVAQTSNKVSAVEQLKKSKQHIQPPKSTTPADEGDVSILDLSSSPRTLRNRKFANPASPSRNGQEKQRPVPKLLSPRSQWRFANPRSDVLSSTILEDCHEDESPNTSGEHKAAVATESNSFKSIKERFEKELPNKPMTASQRLQAQRAQFFNSTPVEGTVNKSKIFTSRPPDAKGKMSPPTLETAF